MSTRRRIRRRKRSRRRRNRNRSCRKEKEQPELEQQKEQWTGVEKEAGAAGVREAEVGKAAVRAAVEEVAEKVQRRTR